MLAFVASVGTKAIRKVQDAIKDLKYENARLQRDIATLQETNESMKVAKDRLDNEIVFMENNVTKGSVESWSSV